MLRKKLFVLLAFLIALQLVVFAQANQSRLSCSACLEGEDCSCEVSGCSLGYVLVFDSASNQYPAAVIDVLQKISIPKEVALKAGKYFYKIVCKNPELVYPRNGRESFEVKGLCGNNVCDVQKGESYNSCPKDCPSTGRDEVCSTTSGDGCDLDCKDLYGSGAAQYDSDCGDCSDGTRNNQCSSTNAGKYCQANVLRDGCGSPYSCACPGGKVCSKGGVCIIYQDYSARISGLRSRLEDALDEVLKNGLSDEFLSDTNSISSKIDEVQNFANEYDYPKAEAAISNFEDEIKELKVGVQEKIEEKKKQTQMVFGVGILLGLLALLGIIIAASRRRSNIITIEEHTVPQVEKKEEQQVVKFFPVVPQVLDEGESGGEEEEEIRKIEEDIGRARGITEEMSKTARELKYSAKGVKDTQKSSISGNILPDVVEKTPVSKSAFKTLKSRRASELGKISSGLKRIGEEIEKRGRTKNAGKKRSR